MAPGALLTRLETSSQGTFGRMLAKGVSFFSGELPDKGNAPNISCIPAGKYLCAWTWSNRFARNMYLVAPVVARAGIRKHSANLMGDRAAGFRAQLNGCIALGERLGWMEGQKALLLSSPAIRRFEALMEHKPFTLEVVNGYS